MERDYSTGSQPLIWAVDPFDLTSDDVAQVEAMIVQIFGILHPWVKPIYAPIDHLILSGEGGRVGVKTAQNLRREAQAKFEKTLGVSSIRRIRSLSITNRPAEGHYDSATMISHWAKTQGATQILCQTHGRSGLNRLFMGSFCETLIEVSPLPVLAINHRYNLGKSIEAIHFYIDLEAEHLDSVKKFLKFSKELHCRVKLVSFARGSTSPLEQTRRLKEILVENSLEPKNFKIVTPNIEGDVGKAILADANSSVPKLVAMTNRTDTGNGSLLKSYCAKVVRDCEHPIWIDHQDVRVYEQVLKRLELL